MIGERCGTCEFVMHGHELMKCCVPIWMPEKNMRDFNERIPEDCPIRNKTREEVTQELNKENGNIKK